jgi:hypothetical protein
MSMDEVRSRVPQVIFGLTDEFGTSKTSINPDFDPRIDKSTFEGVRTVSLDFLDGRLVSLWIGYDSALKWKTLDEFVSGISQSLKLANAWTPSKSRGKQLKCADFEMTVTMVAGGPSLRIVDRTAEDTLVARMQAKEDAAAAAGENNTEASVIVGDKHTKTYFPRNCPQAAEVQESNRVIFKSAEEAEKAGYQGARNCR